MQPHNCELVTQSTSWHQMNTVLITNAVSNPGKHCCQLLGSDFNEHRSDNIDSSNKKHVLPTSEIRIIVSIFTEVPDFHTLMVQNLVHLRWLYRDTYVQFIY